MLNFRRELNKLCMCRSVRICVRACGRVNTRARKSSTPDGNRTPYNYILLLGSDLRHSPPPPPPPPPTKKKWTEIIGSSYTVDLWYLIKDLFDTYSAENTGHRSIRPHWAADSGPAPASAPPVSLPLPGTGGVAALHELGVCVHRNMTRKRIFLREHRTVIYSNSPDICGLTEI